MVNVSTIDGIEYGFRIMIYAVLVVLIAIVFGAISWILIDAGGDLLTAIGGIIGLVGGLIVYAGALGVLYKVIADGVERGVQAANVTLPRRRAEPVEEEDEVEAVEEI
ncbi:hypothetical protein L593_08525 [Salinarchaeum sp. Harcht-Bsk1]|uniref:hypothetical protein n=1 Tax=Salinarchaeum sp. Harcht-Bsk1 TaxID=1333523 RepID=UPI00034241E6|nr:hypothetical protein [Salinarchaeum sp. Harcht-Bsk1]AGN01650.1 hypothetical protein L593_08525 [Salinarchaeum sp. Harcht-Bsk1]